MFVDRLQHWSQLFGRWVSGIGLAVFLVCYALLSLNLVQDWKILIGIAAGVLVGLVTLSVATSLEIRELSEKLDSFIATTSLQLVTLGQCQEDLKARLMQVRSGQDVHIRHLGLDMEHAWVRIEEALKEARLPRQIEFELLVLTGDPAHLGDGLPEPVRRLCAKVPASLARVLEGLERVGPLLEERRIQLRFEVREYREAPTIHGFALIQPSKVRYFSFCRWQGPRGSELDWGEHSYRIIPGHPEDPSVVDLAGIFDGVFEHLWHSSEVARSAGTPVTWPPGNGGAAGRRA